MKKYTASFCIVLLTISIMATAKQHSNSQFAFSFILPDEWHVEENTDSTFILKKGIGAQAQILRILKQKFDHNNPSHEPELWKTIKMDVNEVYSRVLGKVIYSNMSGKYKIGNLSAFTLISYFSGTSEENKNINWGEILRCAATEDYGYQLIFTSDTTEIEKNFNEYNEFLNSINIFPPALAQSFHTEFPVLNTNKLGEADVSFSKSFSLLGRQILHTRSPSALLLRQKGKGFSNGYHCTINLSNKNRK